MTFALGREAQQAGYRLIALETTGSTNQDALEQAAGGDPGHLWVVSPHQSAGRGRRGRAWDTPVGNLAASVLTVVDSAALGATLGFVAGIALDAALRGLVPALADGQRVRLKWPNDVLCDGAKLAGILLEARAAPGDRMAVVAGIGVNVISTPAAVPYPVAALGTLAPGVDAAALFEALSDAWVGVAGVWDGGRGFREVRDRWLQRAAGLGQAAVVDVGGERISGVFETIDDEGRLVMRVADGRARTVAAGEVHFGTAATVRS